MIQLFAHTLFGVLAELLVAIKHRPCGSDRHDAGMVRIFWIPTLHRGRIAVVQRPRGGDWLLDDITAFRAAGIDTLVSALGDKEIIDTWLEREAELSSGAGIAFQRFQIPNLLTPPVREALPRLEALAAEVSAGRSVAAHCFASVGRAPTIVASVLVLLGEPPEEAWQRVQFARGAAVPDTHEQRRWVTELRNYRDSLQSRGRLPE